MSNASPGTEWPSGLRHGLEQSPSPVRIPATGRIAHWAGNYLDRETAIDQPGMAEEIYGVPNRNSAK